MTTASSSALDVTEPNTTLHDNQTTSPPRRRNLRNVFLRKKNHPKTHSRDDDDETGTTSTTVSSTDQSPPLSSCCDDDDKDIALQELADLKKLFNSREEVQADDHAFKHNSLENFLKRILLEENTSQWRKTTQLLTRRDSIRHAIHQDFSELILQQQHQRDSITGQLDGHLWAATHMIKQFVVVLAPLFEQQHACLPQTLQEHVFGILQEFFLFRLRDHYSLELSSEALTPGEAAKIVTWMEQEFFEALSHTIVEPSSDWFDDRDRLVNYYLERAVRHELKEFLHSLQHQPTSSIRKDANGHVVSGMAEQVIFLVDSQLKVAKECLPAKYTEQVLAICNQELREMLGYWMLNIGSQWKELGSHRFCATLNDVTRLMELCEARNEDYLQTPVLREAGEHLIQELAEFCLYTTNYLCQHILWSLREPESSILTSVGDASWEADENQSAMKHTIATLKDYFDDLSRWLVDHDYYFPKILKHCFDLTLLTYVESFFSNTMARGVKDPSKVAHALHQDFLCLVIFFNGSDFEKYHGVAGFYGQQVVNSKLYLLECLSKLMSPTTISPGDCSNEIQIILQELADAGAPAVFHLAGLRKKHSKQESIDWLRIVSRARKELSSMEKAQNVASSYKLPDLRNSRYLLRVQKPSPKELHRHVSANTLPVANSTSKLLVAKPLIPRRRLFRMVRTPGR